MAKFDFKWEQFKLTAERLVFTGELDRSIDWSTDQALKDLREQVRKKSETKIIILDLSRFGTWDTEGIEEVIKKLFEPLILRHQAKIGIACPKGFTNPKTGEYSETQIYEDAKLKQEIVDTEKLPWENTAEEVYEKLVK